MDNKMTEYILKHSRKKDKELKYDFMPSLLEIIERPAHKAGTVIILGIFTLLISAVVWACLSKIDVIITSSGSIQPIGNLNVVVESCTLICDIFARFSVKFGDVDIRLKRRVIENIFVGFALFFYENIEIRNECSVVDCLCLVNSIDAVGHEFFVSAKPFSSVIR